AFPVTEAMLRAPKRPLAVTSDMTAELMTRFRTLPQRIRGNYSIQWEDHTVNEALHGTLQLRTRQQPFTLLLRSVDGRSAVRCVSPIGNLADDDIEEVAIAAVRDSGVRIGAVFDDKIESYNLAVEGDVLWGVGDMYDARLSWLLDRVTIVADRLEEALLG